MRTPDDIYDEWLVVRGRDGEEAALRELVERWQPKLLRHALRLTDGADAAGDVVQEAWVAILRGLRRLDDPACFRRWVYQIVTRKCADAVRERQRRRATTSSLAAEPAARTPPNSDDNQIAALRRGMQQLPAEVKSLLAMFYLDGLGVREIAAALSLPEGTVKSRLYYARQELKHILERNER
jgi:RNA polymerase sigma factor (sigma-70 family)